MKDKKGIAASLNNTANVYMYRMMNDSALHYYFKAMEINNEIKKTIHTALLIAALSIILFNTNARGPGAPPPPDHGTEGNEGQGGGAPIGSGLLILLGLGGAYGGYKVYQKRKKNLLD